jgi:hypothetical protein
VISLLQSLFQLITYWQSYDVLKLGTSLAFGAGSGVARLPTVGWPSLRQQMRLQRDENSTNESEFRQR